MMTSSVSTASLSEATRIALARAQVKMVEAQKELASGRHADVGRTLGFKTGQTIALRQEHASLRSIVDMNTFVSSRLSYAQSALQSISGDIDTFLNAAIGGSSSPLGAAAAQRAAEDGLRSAIGHMNASYEGAYLFSGLNTDTRPIADYFATSPAASKQAVDLAFVTEFGISQDDPAVAGITGAAMQSFLDNAFATLFDASAWSGTWSVASDENIESRVSPREVIEASVNANELPFRKLAQAFTMVADLGIDRLSDDAKRAVLDTSVRLSAEATAGLNSLRAGLGIAEDRVSRASERMTIQMDILAKDVGTLEAVDAAEVSVRISALTTRIETSYALTARLHQLSLVNYL